MLPTGILFGFAYDPDQETAEKRYLAWGVLNKGGKLRFVIRGTLVSGEADAACPDQNKRIDSDCVTLIPNLIPWKDNKEVLTEYCRIASKAVDTGIPLSFDDALKEARTAATATNMMAYLVYLHRTFKTSLLFHHIVDVPFLRDPPQFAPDISEQCNTLEKTLQYRILPANRLLFDQMDDVRCATTEESSTYLRGLNLFDSSQLTYIIDNEDWRYVKLCDRDTSDDYGYFFGDSGYCWGRYKDV